MKVILCGINAKYIHSNLAIRYLKEYCKGKINVDIHLKEYTINNYLNEIISDLYLSKPDVLCLSCYIWNIELVKKIAFTIKKIIPNIIIVLGGPEVSYSTEILKEIPASYLITGEGEECFFALMKYLSGEDVDIKSIKNLCYKDENNIIENPKSCGINLEDLPFPYSDFAELENRIIYYEASRGCPFNCQYCLSSIEKGVRFAPIKKVKNELKVLIDKKVGQVKFVDRTFNANKKFATEIIKFLIENDNGITNFHFEVAAELIDDDYIRLFSKARSGLFQLEIGVQSTNNKTLEIIKRKNDFKKITYVVEEFHKLNNIHLHLDLIAGLPLEDFNSFKNSFNDVYNLRPDQLQLGFLKVLKGSGIEHMCNDYDIKYYDFPPYEVLSTSVLSYDEILILKDVEEMVEIYYNTKRFTKVCQYLTSFFEEGFSFFLALARFKKENKLSSILHNKKLTYKFLYDFGNTIAGVDTNKLKWLMKLDMLLHEKLRSIPEFIDVDLTLDYKTEIYEFITLGEEIKELLPEYSDVNQKQLQKLIHIEIFPTDIIKNNMGTGKTAILFNYRKRDINGNAILIEVSV